MATSSVSLHKTTGLRIVFFGVKRQSCSESENCSLSESIDMQKTNANLYIVLVYGFGSDRKLLGTGISEYHRYHYGYCYCRNVIMSQLPDDPASELQSLPNRARLCHTCVWLCQKRTFTGPIGNIYLLIEKSQVQIKLNNACR